MVYDSATGDNSGLCMSAYHFDDRVIYVLLDQIHNPIIKVKHDIYYDLMLQYDDVDAQLCQIIL